MQKWAKNTLKGFVLFIIIYIIGGISQYAWKQTLGIYKLEQEIIELRNEIDSIKHRQ